jgi:hypothetical protein
MVLHWGVHFFAAVVLTIRLHASFASDVNNSMQVTVIEIHVAAAAMAIVLRDFVSFQMDWMFWAHHAVVVTMTMSLYLFVAPPQWLICCFVGAVMEAGSGGYDVFIVASHAYVPLAGYIYGAIMSTSHVVVIWGIVSYACQTLVPQGRVFWAFMPVICVLSFHRQKAVGSFINEENERRARDTKAGKSK